MSDNTTTLDTASHLCGRILYSFKTHSKQADLYAGRLEWLRILEVISIAIAGCGIFSINPQSGDLPKYASAFFGFVGIATSIYLYTKGFEKLIESHRKTSDELWVIKERLNNKIHDFKNNLTTEQNLAEHRDVVVEQVSKIYSQGPQTSSKAYELARKALKVSEENSFTKNELAQILD